MRIRQYSLDEARDTVLKAARLRPPQKDCFDWVHKFISGLNNDLQNTSYDDLIDYCASQGLDIAATPPHLVFSLATGVGKTRLMGAIVAYLKRAGQTNNVLILAPRTAILEKLEREAQPTHPKFLFIDPPLIGDVNLCTRASLSSFRPAADRLNVFLLSPQSITGKDKRFARGDEFRGFSLFEHLRELDDLVVFMDEAHHLGATSGADDDEAAWTAAVRELKPKLLFGLTATPRSGSGVNVVYEYDLPTCLREGRYTKGVDLIPEQRDSTVSDEQWDWYTIDFALRRLDRKRTAIDTYRRRDPSFPEIEPVLLVAARDTEHAEEVASWLRGTRGIPDEHILVTHSGKKITEDNIRRLIDIDQPGSKVRVVVNVFQLSEGWDVTNVYIVAPLRAMATFENAIQTMGRGLRLPKGRRTNEPDVDRLDVLCFGHASFKEIVENVIRFGSADGEPAIAVTPRTMLDEQGRSSQFPITAVRNVEVFFPTVSATYEDPTLDFEILDASRLAPGGSVIIHLDTGERTGIEDGLHYTIDDFSAAVHSRVLAELRFLSEPEHGSALDRLIRRFLQSLGAVSGATLKNDPIKFALFIADEIRRRRRQRAIRYQTTGSKVLTPTSFQLPVPDGFSAPFQILPATEWERSKHFRLPFAGWRKCVHDAAAFDSRGEYAAALLLDQAAAVEWWFKNDPPIVKLPTPAQSFEPDFVYMVARQRTAFMGLLEIKAEITWDGEGSEARVKAASAAEWARTTVEAAILPTWAFAIVLDDDAVAANSLEELERNSLVRSRPPDSEKA